MCWQFSCALFTLKLGFLKYTLFFSLELLVHKTKTIIILQEEFVFRIKFLFAISEGSLPLIEVNLKGFVRDFLSAATTT